MSSNSVRAAVTAALVCSSFVASATDKNFFEDEADFSSQSSSLKAGWGWSSAQLTSMSDSTSTDGDDGGCENCNNTMTIIGQRVVTPDYSFFLSQLFSRENDYLYDDPASGGGGGATSGGSGQGRQAPPKVVSCKAQPTGGNPITIATGTKVQTEVDFAGRGVLPLVITRSYEYTNSSTDRFTGLFGKQRSSSFERGVYIKDNTTGRRKISITRYNGEVLHLQEKRVQIEYEDTTGDTQSTDDTGDTGSNTYTVSKWFDANNNEYRVTESNDSWSLIADGFYERFRIVDGKIAYVKKYSSGEHIYYDYNSGQQLRQMRHSNGERLNLTYNSRGYIGSITLPNQSVISYQYDVRGNLEVVSMPKDVITSSGETHDTTRYIYQSANSAMIGLVDAKGQRFATWEYNANYATRSYHGNQQESFRILQSSTTSSSTVETRRVVTENALGKQTTYIFKRPKNNTSVGWKVVDVQGHADNTCLASSQNYQYSSDYQQLLSKTDWNGAVTRFEYDNKNRVTKEILASNTVNEKAISYTWNDKLGEIEKVVADGLTTEYEFDGYRVGRKIMTNTSSYGIAGQKRQWQYSYTTNGNAGMLTTKVIDGPRTDVDDRYTYHFDSSGNLTELEMPPSIGYSVYYENYNVFGKPQKVTLPDGTVNEYVYGERGWIRKVIKDANGAARTTSYHYDGLGQVTSIVQPNNQSILFSYDNAHRVTSIRYGSSPLEFKSFGYDRASNLTAETIKRISFGIGSCNDGPVRDPRLCDLQDNETVLKSDQRTYDSLNRLKSIISGGSVTKSYEYDVDLKPSAIKDALNRSISQEHDEFGRLSEVIDRRGGVTRFTYNNLDQVTKVIDPRGNATLFYYDGFGNLVRQVSPDSGTTYLEYDEAGNLVRKTDARGVSISYNYDALNRLVDTSLGYRYQYDTQRKGYLAQLSDNAGTHYFQYNALGEMTQVKHALSGKTLTTNYQYNALGAIDKITYPNGVVVDYGFDAQGRPNNIKVNGSTLISSVNYKPFGPVADLAFGNGVKRTYVRNNRYQLTRLLASGLQDLSFQYDANSNIQRINDPYLNRTNKYRSYSFDANERLQSSYDFNASLSYLYDANGNRLQKGSTRYSYASNSNRLSSVQSSSISTDRNGNIIRFGSKSFDYNDANRLSSFANGSTAATYHYDAFGKRLKKSVNGTHTFFAYLPSGKIGYEVKGNTHLNYIYLGHEVVGVVKNKITYPVLSDHLGRPEVVINASKSTVWRAENAAFERRITRNSFGEFNLGFPGQYYDSEKDSWYNVNRDYDDALGRYLQSDPVGLTAGVNTYAYALNNPIRFVDPLGLDIMVCNRAVDGFPFVGNHAYAWDTTTNSSASMRGSSGQGMADDNEKGPKGDACNVVKNSKGKEKAIMDFMNANKNNGIWTPYFNDCHNAVQDAVESEGLVYPGAPGGRLGSIPGSN
ncbi:MAG: RHS repeat protein [Gammaproteobacteria bacterium]|nr:RHS repeat protein [Gammaproteobacteria bacterium]NVK87384.1 RHS repeat protein [Gammaproteobacteria bacterium]